MSNFGSIDFPALTRTGDDGGPAHCEVDGPPGGEELGWIFCTEHILTAVDEV